MHACIPSCAHTLVSYARIHEHTHQYTCIHYILHHTYIHFIHAHTSTCMHTYSNTNMHANQIRIHMLSHACTYVRTCCISYAHSKHIILHVFIHTLYTQHMHQFVLSYMHAHTLMPASIYIHKCTSNAVCKSQIAVLFGSNAISHLQLDKRQRTTSTDR